MVEDNAEDRIGAERRIWFRRQVLPLEPRLRLYALRLTAHLAQDPEDLVHETFAKLIDYANWQRIENVEAFAVSTLKNIALQALRRQKIMPIYAMYDLEALQVADDEPGADRVVEARDEIAMLFKLIEDLPPQCRQVFTLRKIYGLSHAQIAEKLSLSISTIEKHVIKGLRLCSQGMETGRAARGPRGNDGSRPEEPTRATERRGGRVGRPPV